LGNGLKGVWRERKKCAREGRSKMALTAVIKAQREKDEGGGEGNGFIVTPTLWRGIGKKLGNEKRENSIIFSIMRR